MARPFVPLAGAAPVGEDVKVRYSKEQVKDAPGVNPEGELSRDEEEALYRHYGMDYDQAYAHGEADPEAARRALRPAASRP